jgi:hypothetical protein
MQERDARPSWGFELSDFPAPRQRMELGSDPAQRFVVMAFRLNLRFRTAKHIAPIRHVSNQRLARVNAFLADP